MKTFKHPVTRRDFGRQALGGCAVVATGGASLLYPKPSQAFIGLGFLAALVAISAAIAKVSLDLTVFDPDWMKRFKARQADALWIRQLRKQNRQAMRTLRRQMRITSNSSMGANADADANILEATHSPNLVGQYPDPETAFSAAAVWYKHNRFIRPLPGHGYEDQFGDKWRHQVVSISDDIRKEAGDFLDAVNRQTSVDVGVDPGAIRSDVNGLHHSINFVRV